MAPPIDPSPPTRITHRTMRSVHGPVVTTHTWEERWATLRLVLWDEQKMRLVSFNEALRA